MSGRIRGIAVAASILTVIGSLVMATPAGARGSDWNVVWNGGLTPSALPNAVVGQTFSLQNLGGESILVENDTGAASSAGGSCTSPNFVCWVPPTDTVSFTIDGPGVVRITKGESGELAKLTLGAGTTTEPLFVYPTLLLDANGGTCTGPMKFIRRQGQNDIVYLPTTPENVKGRTGVQTCTRDGYTLAGWARTANASTPDFGLEDKVPISNETFTLYAVWGVAPGFVRVTYDANVASSQSCTDENGKEVANRMEWSASRQVFDLVENRRIVVLDQAAGSLPLTTAPCRPFGAVLSGWSTKPGDAGAGFFNLPYAGTKFALTKSLSASDPSVASASALQLYAVWQYPVVKLHVLNFTGQGSVTGSGWFSNVVVPWGSTIPTGPPVFSGFLRPIPAFGDCATQPVTIANSVSPGLATPSIVFEALDTLGHPAPYTTIAMVSLNAIMNIAYSDLGSAAATSEDKSVRYSMFPVNPLYVPTNALGLSTLGAWGEHEADRAANYLAIYPCPAPSPGKPAFDPSLVVITQSDKSIFGQITFDLG